MKKAKIKLAQILKFHSSTKPAKSPKGPKRSWQHRAYLRADGPNIPMTEGTRASGTRSHSTLR